MKRLDEWQRQRGRLNHDWLNWTFLPFLGMAINIIEGAFEDSTYLDVLEWHKNIDLARLNLKDISTLVSDAPQALSPARLVDEPPICHLDPSTKEWLKFVLEVGWCGRLLVNTLCDDADRSLEIMKRSLSRISDFVRPDCRSLNHNDLILVESHIRSLYENGIQLNKTIGKMPGSLMPL